MNLYAEILCELNSRHVIRTYNSPVGDYAEWLVSEKLGLELEKNAKKGYDAYKLSTGKRFQIKCRWERGAPCIQSRELSVIRNYEDHEFDELIVIIFDAHFSVKEAYSIPHNIICDYARKSKHLNGRILVMTGKILKDDRIKNITKHFQ